MPSADYDGESDYVPDSPESTSSSRAGEADEPQCITLSTPILFIPPKPPTENHQAEHELPMNDIPAPAEAARSAHTSPPDSHQGWESTSVAMARCDFCNKASRGILQRCVKCKMSICKECFDNGRIDKDEKHNIKPGDVSWEPIPKPKSKKKGNDATKKKATRRRQGVRGRGMSMESSVSRLLSDSPASAYTHNHPHREGSHELVTVREDFAEARGSRQGTPHMARFERLQQHNTPAPGQAAERQSHVHARLALDPPPWRGPSLPTSHPVAGEYRAPPYAQNNNRGERPRSALSTPPATPYEMSRHGQRSHSNSGQEHMAPPGPQYYPDAYRSRRDYPLPPPRPSFPRSSPHYEWREYGPPRHHSGPPDTNDHPHRRYQENAEEVRSPLNNREEPHNGRPYLAETGPTLSFAESVELPPLRSVFGPRRPYRQAPYHLDRRQDWAARNNAPPYIRNERSTGPSPYAPRPQSPVRNIAPRRVHHKRDGRSPDTSRLPSPSVHSTGPPSSAKRSVPGRSGVHINDPTWSIPPNQHYSNGASSPVEPLIMTDLSNALVSLTLSSHAHNPTWPLDICLRHHIAQIWSHNNRHQPHQNNTHFNHSHLHQNYLFPISSEEQRFQFLLAATYHAATVLRLDPRGNVTRAWLCETERDVGYVDRERRFEVLTDVVAREAEMRLESIE